MLPPRRGASVMRRDPCKAKTHPAIAEWVSKGTKSLRGIAKGSALGRGVRAAPRPGCRGRASGYFF